ncbi:MAG TPA: hypothetical protein VLN45_08360, partial [Ignavibacteriaceae bacterium]|nr:hypothetical protein [Ignavibacteriaceae bacterium]
PKSTLTHLIFKNSEEPKSTAEIKVYLNFIYYYDYLKEIVNKYFTKRKIVNLSKEEFREILDKIDAELLASKKSEIISDAINSISDFYNNGGITKSSFQVSLIEAFLKEKKLIDLTEVLQKEVKDNKRKIEIDELKKILFAKPAIKPEPVEEKSIENIEGNKEVGIETSDLQIDDKQIEEIEIPDEKENVKYEVTSKENEIIEDEEIENKKVEDELIEKKKKIEDSVKVTQNEIQKEIKISEEIKEKVEPQKEIKKEEAHKDLVEIEESKSKKEKKPETKKKEPVFIEKVEEEEIQESFLEEEIIDSDEAEANEIVNEEIIEEYMPVLKEIKREKDIFSFLGDKEMDKVVSAVFNDDEDDFINTMEKISSCNGYEQASEILKSVFFTYRVNPYKREAVMLTNAVSNYFDQDN